MTVLGIDLGTTTGFALRRSPDNWSSGAWKLSRGKKDERFSRFARLQGRLREILVMNQVGLVAFEDVKGHKGTYAAQVYGGLLAILLVECADRSVPVVGISVSQLKTFATGKGNADKGAMVAAARRYWPHSNTYFEMRNNDEVDARFLAECAAQAPE